MNFKELYKASKEKVKGAILDMWRDTAPEMYEQYKNQLEAIVEKGISDNIVVENMAQWEACENDDWKNIVNENIWGKIERTNDNTIRKIKHSFSPFKHQYNSWHSLLKQNKSIVVTSGTGSGKTECFMVPLIHSLTKDQPEGGRKQAVEAIFLYPLNALMEDQKSRLNDYISLSGKELKFAVYNGNTPERDEPEERFDNEVATREAIRRDKPNILLTNPSMLEYMLLRSNDNGLFTSELKWIVIDETHTFNGAAGAELAMLIRRILKACGIEDANKVKFATSSATIGSGDDAQSKLKKFISDITGQKVENIEVISGRRSEPKCEDNTIKELLQKKDFIYLRELIKDGDTVEEKLARIDELAEKGLRVRLHFYLQALNFGLYVNPTELENDKFKLATSIPLVEGKIDNHYLDAYYCTECGAILGFGEKDENGSWGRINNDYTTLEDEANTIDDGGTDEDDYNDVTISNDQDNSFYVGVRRENCVGKSCNINDENKFVPIIDGKYTLSQVEIKKIQKSGEPAVYKQVHRCPCCDAHGAENFNPMHSFHMSSNFLSRLIAPILLEQTSEASESPETKPSKGRKYITFADSRQSVAGPTIQQNLETEDVWVTGVLYKKLISEHNSKSQKISEAQDALKSLSPDSTYYKQAQKDLNNAQKGCSITWNDAIAELLKDKKVDSMFLSFAKDQSEGSEQEKREYCLSALYRVMNKRPAGGKNSPENCGLICTTYPILENIKERYEREGLPDAIKDFNDLIANTEQQISINDWCDFIKLFIDHNIRSNGSLFFEYDSDKSSYNNKDCNWRDIDINACRTYRTKDESRRPIDAEKNKINNDGNNRFTNLLANLYGVDKYSKLDDNQKDAVKNVINQLKADLIKFKISENGRTINLSYDDNGRIKDRKWEIDKDDRHYMNLTRIAFKLYGDEVWFDEKMQIPLDTTFKGYSPYRDNDTFLNNVKCEKRELVPFNSSSLNGLDIKKWWQEHRKNMSGKWNHKLQRTLEYIVSPEEENPLYFQAEHTAQVSRKVIKEKTEKFKNGEINIMACSTTMEMGVDLGDLDLVVMNNVPPHPANYKQRAGRAGRAQQCKSASVTICGSDATGVATMADPLNSLICRPIDPPAITLNSEQLIQRHINSFLLRKWVTENDTEFAVGNGDNENDRGMELGEFFSSYQRSLENNINRIKEGQTSIIPSQYKSILDNDFHDQSYYKQFINKLEKYKEDEDVWSTIQNLVPATLNIHPSQWIQNAKNCIEKIAENIDKELKSIRDAFKGEYYNTQSQRFTGRGKRLNYDFTSLYRRNLIAYLSTHQFTPNAHMPVGIVDLVIDENEFHKAENPSRDIKVALFEYAPGQRVFINGATYTIGGVKWNKNFSNNTIKKCSNGHIWDSAQEKCPICSKSAEEWDNFGKAISMITPTGFYPYSESSRITKRESMGYEIGTMLIGAGDWAQNNNQRLYNHRANFKDAKILYYNMGYGKGFYVCKDCGYTIAAPMSVDSKNETETIKALIENKHRYRIMCTLKDEDYDNKILKRHILGGTIETDFCEIALFDELNQPMQYSKTNECIATTLGLMLCRKFADEKGYDRNEMDFIVRRQNGEISICIYDTAKGGIGYSNKLDDSTLIDNLFGKIKHELNRCSSIADILDRQTMKYADKIDIEATLKWLQKEEDYRQIVDPDIQDLFQNEVRVSSYCNVEHAVKTINANDSCTLFFNGQHINKWNAVRGDINWMRSRNINADNRQDCRTFAIYNTPTQVASDIVEIQKIVSPLQGWQCFENGLNAYPLAIINNLLFFTTKEEYSYLDGNWAAKDVYVVEYTEPIQLADWNPGLVGDEHFTIDPNTEINSNELFSIVLDKSPRLQQFVNGARGHRLSFLYHEEYMQNHLSMTIATQFIIELTKKAKATINEYQYLGEKYSVDYDKLGPNQQRQYDYSRKPLKLWTNHLNHNDRDQHFEEVFLNPLMDLYGAERASTKSLDSQTLPHWRDLFIIDHNTGAKIHILPNGGFANGWVFDNQRATRQYYPSNCGMDTSIPIKSGEHRILYDIKVGDL